MDEKKVKNSLGLSRIAVPVVIGIAIVVWLMVKEIDASALSYLRITWTSIFWIWVAFLFVLSRTFFYVWRIRSLCDGNLSWMASLRIILLWEFTSAISPSTVGGTALAVVFLNKEGISVGRSTSVVLLTSFLDELYFVIVFPLLLPFTGMKALFINSSEGSGSLLPNNLTTLAFIGYTIILAWVLIVGYGLFINPVSIRKLLVYIFSLPVLKRWKNGAEKAGSDIVAASEELRSKPKSYWFWAAVTTFMSWTLRYLIVNAIILSFFDFGEHLVLFTRQLVLWIMMIISPTPGGSGFAEIILGNYITDMIPAGQESARSISLTMAVIWRAISYYPFLIAGAFVAPGWIQRKFIPSIAKKK
ncbi:MAG: flippase-like domain-containing protein [Bacteroidales bacterium]|nr:flippase-like domain-containing protein [Bacteroidales bacterium]